MLKKYKNKIKLLTMMLIIFASFGQVKAAEFLPINCPQVYQPVCGEVIITETTPCPTIGGVSCAQPIIRKKVNRTFSNRCFLNATQATFLYNGVCQPAHTCLLNSPPPEFCQTGEKVIVTERDNYGCAVHYGCEKEDNFCADISIPVCSYGKLEVTGDNNGCPVYSCTCNNTVEEVCGLVQLKNCTASSCKKIKETYNNRCLLEKASAEFLYDGKCQDDFINPVWKVGKRIEAEDVLTDMEIIDDLDASDKKYIQASDDSQTATFLFNITEEGEYNIQAKIKAKNSSHNSFFFKIDDGDEDIWGILEDNNSWEKVYIKGNDSGPDFDLTKGLHTLIIRGREDETKLDYLRFLKKEELTEEKEIPKNCQVWSDGCNTCVVNRDGETTICTKKACLDITSNDSKCLMYYKEEENSLEGVKCPDNLILHQNLKAPDQYEKYVKNGEYNGYTKGIVTEAHILQQHLNRLGFSAGKVDGVIGPNTRAAILRLQEKLGTTPDGYIGVKTRELLNNSCQSNTNNIDDDSNNNDNDDSDINNSLGKGKKCADNLILHQNLKAPEYGQKYIKNGRYNDYTKEVVMEAHILQQHLNRLGFDAGKVDGVIGPNTRAAILRLQKYLGTTPDGYVGPKTRALLNNSCD